MELADHRLQIGVTAGHHFDDGRSMDHSASFDRSPDRIPPDPGRGGAGPVAAPRNDFPPFLERPLSCLTQMGHKMPFHWPGRHRAEGPSIPRAQQDHAGFHRADHATLEFEPARAKRFDGRSMGKPRPEARVVLALRLSNGGSKRLGRAPQRASFRFRLEGAIHSYDSGGCDDAALSCIFRWLISLESAQPARHPCP